MFRLTPIACALLVVSQSALAQQEAVTLNTITVVSSREDSPLAKLANNVTVHSAENIQAMQANNLDEVLDNVVGVNFDGAGRFGLQDINIRGIEGGSRVKLLSDGLEIAEAVGFGPFHSSGRQYTDLSNIKQVEIIKGPASSLHGSDAIGGVVSLVNKTADDYLEEGKTTGGSVFANFTGKDNGLHTGFNVARAITPQTKALLSYSYQHTNETDNKGTIGGLGKTRTRPNPYTSHSNSIAAQLSHEVNPQNKFTFDISNYQLNDRTDAYSATVARPSSSSGSTTTVNNAGSYGINNISGHVASGSASDYSNVGNNLQKRFAASLRHDFVLNNAAVDTGYWRLYAQNHESRQITNIDRQTGAVYRNNFYKTKEIGLSAQFDKSIAGAISHDIVYGFDLKRAEHELLHTGYTLIAATGASTDASARNAPITDTTRFGIFAQDRLTFGNSGFTLIPGVRYDYHKLKAKPDTLFYASNNNGSTDFAFNNYGKGRASFRLGGLYDLNDSNALYVNLAQGFRAPNFRESNVSFTNYQRRYGYLANPNLKPETSNGIDLGWRLDNGVIHSDINAYYTRYNNFIEVNSLDYTDAKTGITYFKTLNVKDAEIYGIEWSAGIDLGASNPRLKGLSADVTLAYGKGKNRTTGQPINTVDPFSGSLGIRYDQDNWGVSTNWHFASAKKSGNIDSTNSTIHPNGGYGVLDLNAYYKPTKGLTVRAGVFNVFDKKYVTWSTAKGISNLVEKDRYSEPGRWFGASIKYDF